MSEPQRAVKVLLSLGLRHQDHTAELDELASRLDAALEPPMTSDKLREVNHCWAAGIRLCKKFEGDINPVNLP